MRAFVVLVFLSFWCAGVAIGQAPTSGNVFVGYSFENAGASALDLNLNRPNLQGWQATLEGKVLAPVGIVADFSGHYGSESNVVLPPEGPDPVAGPLPGPILVNVTGHEEEVMFGPRFSLPIGRFRPFAELEFGVGHVNTNAVGSSTSFAMAFGGGIDYRIVRRIAWRFDGDYVRTRFFNATQQDVRLSTGIVFRF